MALVRYYVEARGWSVVVLLDDAVFRPAVPELRATLGRFALVSLF